MAGIQVSGLVSSSSFDWKEIVDKLIEVETIPVTRLEAEKTKNTEKSTALASIKTALTDLQDSVQAMRADNIFSLRTVSSNVSGTTWKTSSASGTPVGSYAIAVSRLATKARQLGVADVGAKLATTSDVTGLTLANLNTANAVTAGIFTINGAQVTVATTQSLQDVFDAISTATGGDVTGAYDPATDKISLTSAGNNEVLLGSTVDTSNFLAAMKLANNAGATVSSSAKLGTVKLYTATLANSGLSTSVTGSGTFAINGVSMSYNASTDRVGDIINRINASGAGVTASYDPTEDRFALTNNATGDTGLSINDSSGLLAALGLTTGAGGAFTHGVNAQFTVNGGATVTSSSNTLAAASHGITGLSVTVDTLGAQTLQVSSDASAMATYVQNFVTKFNDVQNLIENSTVVSVDGTNVSTAVLSGNREVEGWASKLRSLAFDQISGLTGSVNRLDHLGIDFNSTTGFLTVKDSDKLANALAAAPEDVSEFFLKANSGFVAKMYSGLTTLMKNDTTQQNGLGKANLSLDEQIARLQTKIAAQKEQLTLAFIKMLDAQSAAESQQKTLDDAFSTKSKNN
jgi:flagellar hook-associated protein 2